MSVQSAHFASERDFVAQFLLPKLKEGAHLINKADVVDFHVDKPVNGTADLTVEKGGRGLLVIEAKFKKKVGRIERDIEPRDPDVITQAVNYAAVGGFPYYATCNSRRLILFQLKPGIKVYESEIESFEYERAENWAENLLKTVLELVPVHLKPLDDTLLDMLHESFNDLYPEFLLSLRKKHHEKKFQDKYVDWLESQGLRTSDETDRLIAEQSTYLQINKLLFYNVIRSIYADRLKPIRIGEEEDVSEALSGFFADIRKIDYVPIYQSDIISEIPFTARAKERVRTLLDTLNEFDFSRMESDFIGRVYEKLIPPLERKRLGQFYTPPEVVDFIIQLTVTKPDNVLLDPGCGSGSFLVKAYHKLRELNHIPRVIDGQLVERFHQQLLECLYGIDINQFPAHLSVINLAIQNPKARVKKINAIVSDIFDIKPGQATLSGFESITAEGKPTLIEIPPYFDVVVANPPYIRQELLGEKEKQKIKALIESEYKDKLFIGSSTKKSISAVILDKQSDIYIYFYIHGLKFLKNGGRLGYISSNKWLEVGYGEPFQQFLLDSVKIHCIIEFDRAVFSDADVNTAITILEKEANKEKRGSNVVKFLRVKKRQNMDTILQQINEIKENYEDESIRINLVKQSKLTPGKWNIFLRAPPVYQKIASHSKTKRLGQIADVFRGPTTGWNDYFILPEDKVKEWGIEKEYLEPCISSPKKIRGLVTKNGDIADYFLMVHEAKDSIKGTNALKYIEYGEKLEIEVTRGSQKGKRKLYELETVKNRKPGWYSLPIMPKAPIIFQYMIDIRGNALWNQVQAHATDVFYYIKPHLENYTIPLLGYLNSSVTAFLVELYGRSYGGGILKIQAYELKELPCLLPDMLSVTECSRIEKTFKQLVEAVEARCKAEDKIEKVRSKNRKGVGLFELDARKSLNKALENENKAREELDDAVYDALDLTINERRQVRKGLEELQEIRRLRAQA